MNFTSLSVTLLYTAALASFVPLQSALARESEKNSERPRIYWHETFRNYGVKSPDSANLPGLTVENEPVYSGRADLSVNLEKTRLVFTHFLPKDGAENLTNYDVLFDFLLGAGEGDKLAHFEIQLRDAKNTVTPIGFASDAVTIAGDVTKLPFEIAAKEWHTAAITVRGKTMTVFIDNDRAMKQVAEAKISNAAGVGINFQGFAKSPFKLTDILLRSPAPLPDRSIEAILPTLRKVEEAAFKRGATQTVAANDLFGATIRTGTDAEGVKLTVNWNNGQNKEITFTSVEAPDEREIKKADDATSKLDRSDSVIQVNGLGEKQSKLNYYIRPRLRRYRTSYSFTDTYHDIVRDWGLLTKASAHPLKVTLSPTATGVALYLDGSYTGTLEGADVKNVTFTASPSASIGKTFSLNTKYDSVRFEPLDVTALNMAKSFAETTLSMKPGFSEVQGIPMVVASGSGSADIGLTRAGQGNWALEVDEYTARSPFDGLLTEVHFIVPGGVPYSDAWVLFAIDPDPAKDPILTARITHYSKNGIGRNLMADTTITIPRGDEKLSNNITQVGTVTLDAGKKALPLYLAKIPLKSGEILDQYDNVTMNFDLFGKPDENLEQLDKSTQPDPRSTSAVQIFGVTLEKSPVGMKITQAQPGNVFADSEKPETTVILTSFASSRGKLAWNIYDVDGQKVKSGSEDYAFSKADEKKEMLLSLKMPNVGWYKLILSVEDSSGNTLLTHPASFALLGKDTRTAKYESPYSTWWFDGTHGTPTDINFAGPIMFKAGIRKAGWQKHSEEEMAPWMITIPQIRSLFQEADLKKPEAAMERVKSQMEAILQTHPHVKEVLIFHESGPGNDVPPEVLGLKPEWTPNQVTLQQRYADQLNMTGAFLRENFPQLKTVVGNNSASASNIAAILRRGGNPDYIDFIGIESPTQVFPPERLQEWALQGMHIAMDTAKALSGRDIPATGSYEFTYRAERDMGLEKQAEWYTRDVLISLANNFTTISPGVLFDTTNAYYNIFWGASGILERMPYGYPKPAYVAYATLTNVLDRATFKRQLDTGSPTVYAVEFERADKKFVTALWAVRGDADFTLTTDGSTPVTKIEMYGKSQELKPEDNKITVHAGTRPVYLVTNKPFSSVTLTNRTFPEDAARAALAKAAAPLDNIQNVTLDKDNSLDTPQVYPMQLPIRQLGDFSLQQVTDDEKGNALELRLNTSKTPNLNKYITEYTTIRLNTPASISDEPAALGVWLKGNSNWGRVMFEIEDAQGEIWRSLGTGGWGVDILDWPGHLSANFDGWNFISVPLRKSSLYVDQSPGAVSEQWVSSGGDKKIQYPIKLRALIVEMNRKPLHLVDFTTVEPVLRFKDAGGIYEASKAN